MEAVWFLDFEFNADDVHCLVAVHSSGTTLTLWADELAARREAPFPPGGLLVA